MPSDVNTVDISSTELDYWLKSHLALFITRQAIKPLVIKVIKQFVEEALDNIKSDKDNTKDVSCGSCDIHNLLPCPMKGYCKKKHGQCTFHDETNKEHRKCPYGICDKLIEKIKNAHRFEPPWKNTDAKQWGSKNLLEIAKCYMPKDGYVNITCFDRIDFNGVINVIINHKTFQKEMKDNLAVRENICIKAREIGNKIRHSSLAIKETDFNEYIDVLIELLSDEKYFRENAYDALDKLKHLKLREELRLEDFSKVCQEVKNDSDLPIVRKIEEKRKLHVLETFQSDLIRFYRNRQNTLQVSPLHTSTDESLNDLYVQPEVYILGPLGRIPIGNYYDLLYEKLGHRQKDCELREIYITSPSGKGKTTYGKRMVITWCQARDPLENDQKYFTSEDLEALKPFDFAFFIPLKDIKGGDSYIDNMILEAIIPDLANAHKYKTEEFISELLTTQRCIIFLDGLDEYTSKKRTSKRKANVSRIPKRKVRDNCTYITTSRPWKLESVQLNAAQIDRRVEIGGLGAKSADKLIDLVTKKLNSKYTTKMNPDDCKAELKRRGLEEFKSIPIILLQMICLWFAQKPLGRSQCEVYSNIFELLFEKAGQKSVKTRIIDNTDQVKLPRCFDNNDNCKKNKALLILLGKLSFEALFDGNLDTPYVIDKGTIQRCLESKKLIQYCLDIGILTQVKGMDPILRQTEMFSFLHQTFQEFLAGLYISTFDSKEMQRKITDVCHSVADIVDMSTVFVVMCGLCPNNLSYVSKLFVSLQREDPSVQKYLGGIDHDDENFNLKRLQSTTLDCLQESQDSSCCALTVDLECVFITSEIKAKTHHLKNLNHILAQEEKTFKSIEFSNVDETVIDHLQFKQSSLKFGKIGIQECNIAKQINSIIIDSFQTLTCLQLRSVSIDDMTLSAVEKCENLRNLSVWNIQLRHDHFEYFANYISRRKGMKEVELKSIECLQSDHNTTKCEGHTIDFGTHRDLEAVDIFDTCIVFNDICTEKLTRCVLRYIPEKMVLANTLLMLKNAKELQYLVCTNFSQVAELNHILPSLTALKYLEVEFDLTMFQSDDHQNENTIQMSENIIFLEQLKLRRLRLTRESFENYLNEILKLQQATAVIMEEVSFGGDDDLIVVRNTIENRDDFELDETKMGVNVLVFNRRPTMDNSQESTCDTRALNKDKRNTKSKAAETRARYYFIFAFAIVILGVLYMFFYNEKAI